MRPTTLRALLAGILGLGAVVAVRLAAWPLVHPILLRGAESVTQQSSHARPAPLDSMARVVVDMDPFRLSHRPASIQYDPLTAQEQLAPPAPKPVLQLAGIVWEGGADPIAVIEGLPGTDGPRVVRVGDVVAGLRVQRITRDNVRIVSADTTWVLKVRGL